MYSEGGLPRKAASNVAGSARMASTITFRSLVASRSDFSAAYATALNKQLLSLSITRRTTNMSSSRIAPPFCADKVVVDVVASSPMLSANARANASSSSISAMAANVLVPDAFAARASTVVAPRVSSRVTAIVSPLCTPSETHDASSSATSTTRAGNAIRHRCSRASIPVLS